MNKPHWRCPSCDGSRYKVLKVGIQGYSCGRFFEPDCLTVEADGQ